MRSPLPPGLTRIFIGLAVGYLVLERTAALTNSMFGETGLLIAGLTVTTVVLVELFLFGRAVPAALRFLGLGSPARRGLLAVALITAVMLAFFPVFAAATGAKLAMRDGWLLMLPGLFGQAGIGEEVLFRGYLFGHLRQTRSFWRAALLSIPPFLIVHLLLFTSMDPMVAIAATLLSVVMSFPLARLYELGGRTIWAPAVLHFVVQGAIKVVVAPEAQQTTMGVAWMGAALVLPWLAFALRPAPPPVAAPPRGG